MANKPNESVFVPMGLQAFVVGEDFPNTKYRVAPLIQPNYAALRTDSGLVKHDLLEQLNLSHVRLQAAYNSRFVDLSSGQALGERTGVYLSWCLPRVYRAGITATERAKNDHVDAKVRAGYDGKNAVGADRVQFRSTPDRWLVFRLVTSGEGQSASFIVESNRVRNINDDDLRQISRPDVENITSAFVDPKIPLSRQSEIYLGKSTPLFDYSKDVPATYRKPFTIVEAANEFFADYQPHNTSVFSFFDRVPSNSSATITYLVVGFHADLSDDPLAVFDSVNEGSLPTYETLLKACKMDLKPGLAGGFLQQPANKTTRTICHGVLRNVVFDKHKCEPTAPSIALQDMFLKSHPIAIGTHALDALAAYLHTEQSLDDDPRNPAVNQLIGQLVMLIARDDDVDTQRKAAADIGNGDWVAKFEGSIWKLPQHEDAVKPPTDREHLDKIPQDIHLQHLVKINRHQAVIETCQREIRHLKHRLFACWWNAVAMRQLDGTLRQLDRNQVKKTARDAIARIKTLSTFVETTERTRDTLVASLEKKIGKLSQTPTPPYGVHQDPTLLIAGMSSGWPTGFSDPVPVRLSPKIDKLEDWGLVNGKLDPVKLQRSLKDGFPDVMTPVNLLLRDLSGDDNVKSAWTDSAYAGEEERKPQGWFPLFVEWEVEYYHVPWNYWEFHADRIGGWRYRVNKQTTLSRTNVGADRRVIHGRTLITPQTSTTLRSRLNQLFKQTNVKELDKVLPKTMREEILEKVSQLHFFSAPLTGITDHLVTMRRGAHPTPTTDDKAAQEQLGITAEELGLMQETTDLTPYGITSPVVPSSTDHCPFKPVTHGQVRFTKMVIVDKFGQIVMGIDPPQPDGTPGTALYPCISPSLSCQRVPDTYFPNTAVKADTEQGPCQFFQIPPRINQKARLNAHYLVSDGKGGNREAGEWDNPVWGWLLVNYYDYSIMVFNPDGAFVCEVLLARESSSTEASLRPDTKHTPDPVGRLADLIKSMKSYQFARGLFEMLSEAIGGIDSTPSDYADLSAAAFGKPFCIADFGCSIELASPPHVNQSFLSEQQNPEKKLLDYAFNIAVGNPRAAFDGLVGTFASDGPIEEIFTGYGSSDPASAPDAKDKVASASPLVQLTKPLTLNPYFVAGDDPDMLKKQGASMRTLSAIVDPIRPLHVYSGGVFPFKELRLPPWAINMVMRNIRPFFKAGPLLVPTLPAVEMHTQATSAAATGTAATSSTTEGTTSSSAARASRAATSVPAPQTRAPAVQMPLAGVDQWEWLQPRLDNGSTTIDPYTIGKVDEQLRVEDAGVAHVVEGYAMMKRQLQKPEGAVLAAGGAVVPGALDL